MQDSRTIIVNKPSPIAHDLLCVAHSCIAIPGGILIGWLVWSLAGWDVWDGVFKGTIAGLLLVVLVAFGQILPRLAYLRYALYPLAWLVALIARVIDPPRRSQAASVEGRPLTRPVALQHQKVWEQAQRRRGYVAPITINWKSPDTEPLDDGEDESSEDEDEGEGHVIYDVPENRDVIAIIEADLLSKPKNGNWSRSGLTSRFGWTQQRANAALERLAVLGLITPDKLQTSPHIDTIHVVPVEQAQTA